MLLRSALRCRVRFARRFSAVAEPSIGFIGLGNMGGHMANSLLKNGRRLVLFDVNKENAQRIHDGARSKGFQAIVADSPRALAEQVETVITMLPSSPHVKEVYTGASGVLSSVRRGALLIDSSTIDPTSAREVADEATRKGARMVDAPVSGGVGGAEAATLTFMVGGSDGDFAIARLILSLMGKNIVHCGAAGTGQAAKVCNNLVLGISMCAVAEGMNLGIKLGMDPKKLAGIFNTSSGRCWSSDTYNPVPGVMDKVPASRGYTGGFGVDLMKKDLGLALQAAKDAKAPLRLGQQSFDLYAQLSKDGNGLKDFSFVYEYLRQQRQ